MDRDTVVDERGNCLNCGCSLDIDGNGHSEDCRWGK